MWLAKLALGSGGRILRWRDSEGEGEANVNRSMWKDEGGREFLLLCASSALSASMAGWLQSQWFLSLLGMRVRVRRYIHNLRLRRSREPRTTGAYEPEGYRESELRANQEARSKKPAQGGEI